MQMSFDVRLRRWLRDPGPGYRRLSRRSRLVVLGLSALPAVGLVVVVRGFVDPWQLGGGGAALFGVLLAVGSAIVWSLSAKVAALTLGRIARG